MPNFWTKFKAQRPPYVHPADKKFIRPDVLERRPIATFRNYVASRRFEPAPNGFQLSLYPSPYVGDLRNAKVIVLLLNPGFNTGDYYAELESTSFRRARRNTVTRQLTNTEYKFFLLNPAFCWAPGFRWWEQKVRKIALKICDDRKVSYRKALRLISSILAAIELVPYHSVSFGKGCRSLRTTVDELPSVKESIAKVKRLAKNPAVTIYVARQRKRWDAGLKDAEATVLSSNNARGVSFPVDSRIGKAILKAVKRLPA